MTQPTRDPGSFRDPSGCVYHLHDRVYRAVDRSCAALIKELSDRGVLGRLTREGRLVPTRTLQPGQRAHAVLRTHLSDELQFLRHRTIPFIAYPYEWSPTMLADAALCCLDLQLRLIDEGYSLKDASAYNVQFVNGRPVFIDIPSIERVSRRDVWLALDQFCRMFLYPLLLTHYRRTSLKEYFLPHLDGVALDEVARRLGWSAALRPSLWLDVQVPRLLQRWWPRSTSGLRARVNQPTSNTAPLVMNLRRLRRKIVKLRITATSTSDWVDYVSNNSYTDEQVERKQAFVATFLRQHRMERVLDIGCNTGRMAEQAAELGASVVAVDSDVACIDRLYRRAHTRRRAIWPLVMDIANPSPGIGFRHAERASFLDRASFDGVLALALLHHLLISARLPLPAIRDLLADLTDRYLIVEFVGPEDAMFQQLLGARAHLYGDLTLETFCRVFDERFETVSQETLTPHRRLFAMRKRR